jgi:hypothetical protein
MGSDNPLSNKLKKLFTPLESIFGPVEDGVE